MCFHVQWLCVPQFENPPLLGTVPGGAPALGGLMGLAPGGPALPLHAGGQPSLSRPQDIVPVSMPLTVGGIPPPPLMGQVSHSTMTGLVGGV